MSGVEKGSGFVEKDAFAKAASLLLQKQHTKLGPSGPKFFLQHSPFAENEQTTKSTIVSWQVKTFGRENTKPNIISETVCKATIDHSNTKPQISV